MKPGHALKNLKKSKTEIWYEPDHDILVLIKKDEKNQYWLDLLGHFDRWDQGIQFAMRIKPRMLGMVRICDL